MEIGSLVRHRVTLKRGVVINMGMSGGWVSVVWIPEHGIASCIPTDTVKELEIHGKDRRKIESALRTIRVVK